MARASGERRAEEGASGRCLRILSVRAVFQNVHGFVRTVAFVVKALHHPLRPNHRVFGTIAPRRFWPVERKPPGCAFGVLFEGLPRVLVRDTVPLQVLEEGVPRIVKNCDIGHHHQLHAALVRNASPSNAPT